MGKKMKLPSLFFKNKQWPSCKQPKTHSFRAGDEFFKTVNSVYFDSADMIMGPESWFTNTSESGSFSTVSEEVSGEDTVEMVIRGLRSERLFFEPGESNSILENVKTNGFRFKESVVVEMESEDPYLDFRTSMEEMVEAHGFDWECLEELLSWYLKVNGVKSHGFIVNAFVDLIVSLASSFSSSCSFCSPLSSSCSSPSLALLQVGKKEEEDDASSSEI